MSVKEKIWGYLLEQIGNQYGVAGLMANLYVESGFKPNNLQNSREAELGYDNDSYTEAVDRGTYNNFSYDKAGYGLAQWTHWSRKEKLLEFAKSGGRSIGDLSMQLEFLVKEIKESYKTVWEILKSAKSVREASDVVLLKFERPARTGESVRVSRARHGERFYEEFAKKEEVVEVQTNGLKFKKGDIVFFSGNKHYRSAKSEVCLTAPLGRVKITDVSPKGVHKYHCRSVDANNQIIKGVFGWVNEEDLEYEPVG